MRSALAGTASNVTAVTTAAVVPMSVIERMFSPPLVPANNEGASHEFLETMDQLNFDWGTFREFLAEHLQQWNCIFTSLRQMTQLCSYKKSNL